MGRAIAAAPNDATFLFFGGTDLWRYGAFLYGGAVWSPGGVDNSGVTLKTLISGGEYKYTSGALNTDIKGATGSAAILPGWKFINDKLIVNVYAGPVVQDYRLSPNDPSARLHGSYVGGEVASDVWYEPTSYSMISVNGMLASIGPTGSLRVALGTRFLDRMFVGPESEEIGAATLNSMSSEPMSPHSARIGSSGRQAQAGRSRPTTATVHTSVSG